MRSFLLPKLQQFLIPSQETEPQGPQLRQMGTGNSWVLLIFLTREAFFPVGYPSFSEVLLGEDQPALQENFSAPPSNLLSCVEFIH